MTPKNAQPSLPTHESASRIPMAGRMALVAVLAGLVILATVSDGQQYARPPLFTSEDLGPVPSAAENGFEEFMDGFKSAGLLEPPVGGRRQWPAVLTDALSWSDVREKAVEIRKAASLDHVARVSAVLDHATRKPHFVHGSPKYDAMPFHWRNLSTNLRQPMRGFTVRRDPSRPPARAC